MANCALVTTALGLYEVYFTNLYRFEGVVMFLHVVRLYVIMPVWFGVFLLTFWRGCPRWADPVNLAATTLSCWGHSLMIWSVARANPRIDLVNALTGSTILVLIIAVLTLPMASAPSASPSSSRSPGDSFFVFTLGRQSDHHYGLRTASLTLNLVGALVVMRGWFREAADRRLFAQREHARTLAAELAAAANAELARINAEKNGFMAIASHDLRSTSPPCATCSNSSNSAASPPNRTASAPCRR